MEKVKANLATKNAAVGKQVATPKAATASQNKPQPSAPI